MFMYVIRTLYVHPKCQLDISSGVRNQFLTVSIHFGTKILILRKNICVASSGPDVNMRRRSKFVKK